MFLLNIDKALIF